MSKVLAIFGAGPGLSSSVARRYAAQGYALALVARNPEKLSALAESFRSEGIRAETFSADLSDPAQGAAAVRAIEAAMGGMDVLYYAPIGQAGFAPAAELTPEGAARSIALFYYGLLSVVHTALPGLRSRKGRLLAAFGGTAKTGFAHLSGVGPAMAAARNYLQSLQLELAPEGVSLGVVTIFGVVKNSAAHQKSREGSAPVGGMPEVDPEDLTDALLAVAEKPGEFEVVMPPSAR